MPEAQRPRFLPPAPDGPGAGKARGEALAEQGGTALQERRMGAAERVLHKI